MNQIKEIQRISMREAELGIEGKASWHHQYKDSSYVCAGGLPVLLTEGDVLCVFSQWGEIIDINLLRDKATGKSMGTAFIGYEDQRSTVLAVDNFNGMKLKGRTIKVDHVLNYRGKRKAEDKNAEVDPLADEKPVEMDTRAREKLSKEIAKVRTATVAEAGGASKSSSSSTSARRRQQQQQQKKKRRMHL